MTEQKLASPIRDESIALDHIVTLEEFLDLNEFASIDSFEAAGSLNRRMLSLNKSSGSNELAQCTDNAVVMANGQIAAIESYAELERLYRSPDEIKQPAELAALCLVMMRRLETGAIGDTARAGLPVAEKSISTSTIPYGDIQRRLSRLLVDFPILMHSRVLIGVRTSSIEYANIACAIAELSFGALPRESHGITRAELQVFAGSCSVRNGLSRISTNTNLLESTIRHRTPLQVAMNSVTGAAVAGATRAQFLISLIELSRLAETECGTPFIDYKLKARADDDGIFRALKRIFCDVATNGGKLSNLTADELSELFKLPAPFRLDTVPGPESGWTIANFGSNLPRDGSKIDVSTSRISGLLKLDLDAWLFHSDRATKQPLGLASPNFDEMVQRTHGTISLLVAAGLVESPSKAAELLSRAAVGSFRVDSISAGPQCTLDCALGFLEAIHSHGVTVDLDNEAVVLDATSEKEFRLRALATWQQAIHVHTTKKSMESVITPRSTIDVGLEDEGRAPTSPSSRSRRRGI